MFVDLLYDIIVTPSKRCTELERVSVLLIDSRLFTRFRLNILCDNSK